LLAEADRVIATAVERTGRHAAKVADAWQRDVHQLIQERPHALSTQGGHDANGHPGTQLEGGDRLPRPRHHRSLASDGGEIAGCCLDCAAVLHGLAEPDVDHDLLDARHLHDVVVMELTHQRGYDFFLKALSEALPRLHFHLATTPPHPGPANGTLVD